jgi:hypothetical protein
MGIGKSLLIFKKKMGIQGEMVEQPASKSKFSLFNMENSKKKLWQESPNSHYSRNGHFKKTGKGGIVWSMGGKFGREVGWDQKFEVQKGDQLMLLDQICLFVCLVGLLYLGDLLWLV